jgi:hypothetical protein
MLAEHVRPRGKHLSGESEIRERARRKAKSRPMVMENSPAEWAELEENCQVASG